MNVVQEAMSLIPAAKRAAALAAHTENAYVGAFEDGLRDYNAGVHSNQCPFSDEFLRCAWIAGQETGMDEAGYT